MKNKEVVVFGGSGFLGRYVVERLARQGAFIKVPTHNLEKSLFLKTTGFVGQITPLYTNVFDDKSVSDVIKGADYVINLIGILHERGKSNFENMHVDVAQRIAKLCKKHKVKRLVHISAIGANVNSRSRYASTKGKGEKAVLKDFPEATIIRPSILFGEEDNFFNRFANLSRFSPFLPLVGGGHTKFQPVYVDDVAHVIVKSLTESKENKNPHAGKTYELGGPDVYTFKEILLFILKNIHKRRLLVPLPFPFASLVGFFTQFLPNPILTRDQVTLLKSDNIVGKRAVGFKKLGIEPTAVETVVPKYLARFIYHG